MPADIKDTLAQNIETVFEQVHQACQESGRATDSVQIVAVTKYVDRQLTETFAEVLQDFLQSHPHLQNQVPVLGESRPQVLSEKQKNWSSSASPHWHMIGHLQTNKIKQVVPNCHWIHSIDRLDLADKLESYAKNHNFKVRGLVQFNISEEENKGGFQLDRWKEVAEQFALYQHLEIYGVMGMGGLAVSGQQTSSQFRRLKETQQKLYEYQNDKDQNTRNLDQGPEKENLWKEVSMGMSGDFALAIAEGSTIVRIGSAFFKNVR